MRRIMIIVWKWETLIDREPPEDIFYIKETNNDLIIRLNYRNSKASRKIILDYIKKQNKDDKVIVFLHRKQDYQLENVAYFFNKVNSSCRAKQSFKCFLFGWGSDFIYYLQDSVGLLGQFGDFMNAPEYYDYKESGKRAALVYDYNEKLNRNEIIPYYFNTVWNYYFYGFKRKIFELKEDFLIYCVEFFIRSRSISEVATHIEKNRLLLNRIFNFIHKEDFDKKYIIETGQKAEKIYLFGDELNNIEEVYGKKINRKYKELASTLNLILEGKNIERNTLKTIRNQFDTLLNGIPGEIYG